MNNREDTPKETEVTPDSIQEDTRVVSKKNVESVSFIENKTLTAIVEHFIAESQLKLSSFLRKKIVIKYNDINICKFAEINHDYTKLLMLNFHIDPHDKYALFTFDFIFLHSVINLLFGGVVNPNERVMSSLGKSGLRIAKKLTTLFLEVLEEIMNSQLTSDIKLSYISAQLSSVFKQDKSQKCYNISLLINVDSVTCNLNIVVPEVVFSRIEVKPEANDGSEEVRSSHAAPDAELVFDDKVRKELVDSYVVVSANLPKISLKLKKIINLKPGDIIPIDDPTIVHVTINNKDIFMGSAGQSMQRRVVKIINKL